MPYILCDTFKRVALWLEALCVYVNNSSISTMKNTITNGRFSYISVSYTCSIYNCYIVRFASYESVYEHQLSALLADKLSGKGIYFRKKL